MAKIGKFSMIAIENQRLEKQSDGKVSLFVTVRLRRWHPSYWFFYWKVAFSAAKGYPFHLWFPVALKRFLLPREWTNKTR